MSYLLNVALGIDQLANTLVGGDADETLSARAHRLKIRHGRPWPARFINALFFWQEDHCKEAYESEVLRRQLPASYR